MKRYEDFPFGLFAEGDGNAGGSGATGESAPTPAPGTADAAQADLAKSDVRPSLVGEAKPEEKPVAEAPPAYDAEKLTFPDGFTKDEATLGKFGEIAKEHGITMPAAQALMNLYADVVKAEGSKNTDAWNTTRDGWITEVNADKEIGGEKLETVKRTVATLLDNRELTDPGIRQALDLTGAGDNPAVIRTLYRWASRLNEGSQTQGGNPNRDPNLGPTPNQQEAKPVSAATALYPNLPSGVNRG